MNDPSLRSGQPLGLDLPAEKVDLVVVGAGIVGLAHAYEAHRRGLSVLVVERHARAVGASVRNFGHVCTTAQSGHALELAQLARETWLELGQTAGLPVRETGTLLVARHEDELSVLEEFARERGPEQVQLLTTKGVGSRLPTHDPAVMGGALLPRDLRTDPLRACSILADWLESRGVRFAWRTTVAAIEPGVVRTSRGVVSTARVVVCTGHDLDLLHPDVADEVDLSRCRLAMLEIQPPEGWKVEPAVLTGTSMLRYAGLAAQPSASRVRSRLESEDPRLLAAGVNLMLTQRPDGTVVLGDTHRYDVAPDPFIEEALFDLLLEHGSRLLGLDPAEFRVRRRWQGVYASSPQEDFVVREPFAGARLVVVASGIGMTTCHGLAAQVMDDLLDEPSPRH